MVEQRLISSLGRYPLVRVLDNLSTRSLTDTLQDPRHPAYCSDLPHGLHLCSDALRQPGCSSKAHLVRYSLRMRHIFSTSTH